MPSMSLKNDFLEISDLPCECNVFFPVICFYFMSKDGKSCPPPPSPALYLFISVVAPLTLNWEDLLSGFLLITVFVCQTVTSVLELKVFLEPSKVAHHQNIVRDKSHV